MLRWLRRQLSLLFSGRLFSSISDAFWIGIARTWVFKIHWKVVVLGQPIIMEITAVCQCLCGKEGIFWPVTVKYSERPIRSWEPRATSAFLELPKLRDYHLGSHNEPQPRHPLHNRRFITATALLSSYACVARL